MGYTHYWYQKKDFTTNQWNKIKEDVLTLIVQYCDRNNVILAYEFDSPSEPQPSLFGGQKYGPKVPEVNSDQIRFNGWKEEGHETFLLTREKPGSSPECFNFCKTARKPYDVAVCLTLLICYGHAPKAIRISSDGSWDHEWLEARNAFKELFGVEPSCPFEEVTA